MDTRLKTVDEINIKDVIDEMRKWSKDCRVLTEDDIIDYYYFDGNFYKDSLIFDDVVLTEAQIIEELTVYRNTAATRFVNDNICIFDLTA